MTDDDASSRVLRDLLPRRPRSPATHPVAAPPWPRRTPESARPEVQSSSGPPAPRSPEISALLADLQSLRLVLATDLALAAAAVEAGRPALAVEAVDADRAELCGFQRRASTRLQDCSDRERTVCVADSALATATIDNRAEQTPPAGPMPWLRRLLPAVPSLVAAPLVGLLAGLVPGGRPRAPR